MPDRIKLRRGSKSKIDLNVYELGYVTDPNEQRLYFNNGSIVPIPNNKDITDIKTELTKTTNASNKNKQDISDLKVGIDDITTQLNAKANNCYKIFENLDGKHIKFLGDSVSGGSGGTNCSYTGEPIGRTTNKKANDVGKCWVNSLRAYFNEKYSCTTKNWSVSGWKSSDIVKYLSELIEEEDDIIICAIGANNCYISDGIQKLKSDIKTINDYCISRGKKIIYVGTIQTKTCANETHGIKMEDIDNCLRELCTKLNSYFVPMYKLFNDYILTCGYNSKLLYFDEEHPNDNGYNVMYYLIANYLGFYTDLEIRNKLYKLYDTGWINMPLGSGITVDDGLTPQCRRIGNTVMIRGSVAGLDGTGGRQLCSVPAGFRPIGQNHYYRAPLNGYIGASVAISTNGVLYFQGAGTASASGWLVISTSFAID